MALTQRKRLVGGTGRGLDGALTRGGQPLLADTCLPLGRHVGDYSIQNALVKNSPLGFPAAFKSESRGSCTPSSPSLAGKLKSLERVWSAPDTCLSCQGHSALIRWPRTGNG